MARLPLFTDENVPRAFASTLRSNGFRVQMAYERHGENTRDPEILASCASDGLVLVTNDRDFVEYGDRMDHAGIIIYTNQALSPGSFATGVRRIDRQFTATEMLNNVEWLERWL